MKRIGLFLIIMLCVSACSTAQPAPTSTSPPLAERSPTMAADPAETSDALPLFTITFDGSGCASEVPEKLPLGKYSFLVVNNTDTELPLLIALLPEGVTFQDLLDKQSEPGEYVYPIYGLRTPIKLAQNWDDSLGGKFYTFSFYEEGEYSQALGGFTMDALWYCAPFHVTSEATDG